MPFTCRNRQRFEVYVSKVSQRLITIQLKLRLETLLDKKRVMQSRSALTSKISTSFITLEEGFQQFGNDLNKLLVRSCTDRLHIMCLKNA